MPCQLGGLQITDSRWTSPTGLTVWFSSTYGSTQHYQLYAGRTLIAVSNTVDQRALSGVLVPSHWPQEITLAAVAPVDRLTDFGSRLPPRPYNRVNLAFTVGGWTDGKFVQITAGDVPGGSVDTANVLALLLYDVDRQYSYITPPLPGSGVWNLQAAGVDGTDGGGNVGPPLPIAQNVLAYPPDVLMNEDGSRLAVSIAGGVATVGFSYDW